MSDLSATLDALFLDTATVDRVDVFRQLHAAGGVHRHQQRRTLYVADHPRCLEVLRHEHLGKGRGSGDILVPAPSGPVGDLPDIVFTASLVHLDPPEHTRLRGFVAPHFVPARLEQLRPMVAQVADAHIARMRAAGGGDLIDDLAYPVPLAVMAHLLGVPVEDGPRLRELVREQALLFEPAPTAAGIARGTAAAREMAAYFAGVVRARRRAPGDDLLSVLMATRGDAGDRLSKQELVGLAMLLMGAGIETTANLIGNAFGLVVSGRASWPPDPGPSALRSFVEEVLRVESPVQLDARQAKRPTAIGGHDLVPGDWIVVLLGAANRDPAVFADPDRFRPDRAANPHLSFSAGIHHCLGAGLARLEARIVLERWLAAGATALPTDDGDLRWRAQVTSRGLEELPVTLR